MSNSWDGIREDRAAGLGDALLIATLAHEDQTDKAGAPYLLHPLRMVIAALERGCAPDVAIVAALHDVVEDSAVTLDDLATSGFSPSVIRAVDALTRREGESYPDFIERCADGGAVARCVKLLDIDDNLAPARLSSLSGQERSRLTIKYTRARDRLS